MPHGLRVLDRRVRLALQAQALRVATAGGTSRFNAGSSPSVDNVNKGTGLVYCNPKSIDQNGRFWQKGLLSGSSHHYFGTAGTGSGALEAGVFKSTASTNFACDVTADAPTYAAGKWCFVGYEWDTGGADADQKIFHGDHGNPCVEASGYLVQTAGTGSIGNDASVDGFLLNNSAAATAFAGDVAVIVLLKNPLLTLEELRIWQEMMELGPDALLNEPLPRRDSCVGMWFPGLDGTYFIPDYSGFGNHAYAAGAVMTLARGMPGWVRRPRVAVAAPSGNDTTLAASVTCSISSAAALQTDIRLAGTAALSITSAGALSTSITMAAQAQLAVTVAGALSTDIKLAAAAQLAVTAAAGLTTDIRLAGAATLSVTGVGALTTDIRMAAAVSVVVTTTGSLEGAALFDAAVSCTISVAAGLTTDIRLAGAVTLSVAAVAAMTTAIRLAATPVVAVSATGALATDIRLAAAVGVSAAVAGALATDVRLSATVVLAAAATGNLATDVRLAAAALLEVLASGVLEVGIPLSRWRLIDCSIPGYRLTDRSVPAHEVTDKSVPEYRIIHRP